MSPERLAEIRAWLANYQARRHGTAAGGLGPTSADYLADLLAEVTRLTAEVERL